MLRDAQQHDLSEATPEAIASFDAAVRAFTLVYGDTLGLYEAARAAAPNFVMAHLGKAWVLSLASDPILAQEAKRLLEGAAALARNQIGRASCRERV